jgi:hypothetical protein
VPRVQKQKKEGNERETEREEKANKTRGERKKEGGKEETKKKTKINERKKKWPKVPLHPIQIHHLNEQQCHQQ